MLRFYERTLQGALRYRGVTVAAAAVVLVLTGVLFIVVPKGSSRIRTRIRSR
jgi:uncharacterized protein YjeT (DUF2065 family)